MWVTIISVHERHSDVLLNWIKTALVNTVYKLLKLLFSYTRVYAKLGTGLVTLFWRTKVNQHAPTSVYRVET